MNILQEIFLDHYEEIIYTLHPRDSVVENVDKMIHCGDPSYGGAMYVCPQYHNMKFVPFRCKSRFCPTCGVKYCQERSTQMSFKLVHCTHRHCVFTIDEELRHFFLEDRSLLDCLFQAVRSVILRMFHKLNKSRNFVPGFVCVLHTFGRPVIALNRIDSYDGDHVTFHYNRHEDNVFVRKTIPAMEFIKLLIQHIPEKQFKMTRYYGLYARHRELDRSLRKAIHRSKHRILKSFTQWRNDILLSFGYDPLSCPCCHREMMIAEVYYKHERVSLQDLYERVMAKAKCRSS